MTANLAEMIDSLSKKIDSLTGILPAGGSMQTGDLVDGGVVASATTASIVDPSKSWDIDSLTGYTVEVDTTPHQIREISSNSSTSLLVTNPFSVAPGQGNRYVIRRAQVNINIAASDITIMMNLSAASIMMPIDLQGSYIMMPVDIQAQYLTLDINIKSQTAAINMNIAAQNADVTINIHAQSVGIKSQGEYAPANNQQKYLVGEWSSIAAGQEGTPVVSYTVPGGVNLYLTELSFTICATDLANADLNQIGAAYLYDSTAGVFLARIGGNGGGGITFPTPKLIPSGHVLQLIVYNNSDHNAYMNAATGGYQV